MTQGIMLMMQCMFCQYSSSTEIEFSVINERLYSSSRSIVLWQHSGNNKSVKERSQRISSCVVEIQFIFYFWQRYMNCPAVELEPRAIDGCSIQIWSGSEYSLAYFTHWQEFCTF